MEAPKLCDDCIFILTQKFTFIDVKIMISINPTTFVKGKTREEIYRTIIEQEAAENRASVENEASADNFKKGHSAVSKDQVYDSLVKLEALTFINFYRNGRTNYYYVTEAGKRAVSLIYLRVNGDENKKKKKKEKETGGVDEII